MHLEKDDLRLLGNVTEAALVGILILVFQLAAVIRFICDDTDVAVLGICGHEFEGRGIQLHRSRPQLQRPLHPGDDRDYQDADDEQRGNADAVRSLDHVGDGRVQEHKRHDREPDSALGLLLVQRRERHRDGCRGDQHQYAGRIGAALGIHVGLEDDRDEEGNRSEHEHEGANGASPGRRHAIPREVPRHEVEESRHRGGSGEPEDADRGDVIDGAENRAEVLVGEVGESTTVGGTSGLEGLLRDEDRRHEARGDQECAHDDGGAGEQAMLSSDAANGIRLDVIRVPGDLRHDCHASLEAGESEG